MVTKIIVACILPLLADLVSTLQTTFIPRKKGIDNAIIVQELIHSMSTKKGRDGVMAIKINLEKAYNWLEWDFIRDTLNLFKFLEHLSSIILSCISFATVLVLYNGGALEPFHPSRGIRQEDPLSPYLFSLCMEVLGALIIDKCQTNLWNAIPASKGGISFSHLFFVDDLVLFA